MSGTSEGAARDSFNCIATSASASSAGKRAKHPSQPFDLGGLHANPSFKVMHAAHVIASNR
jgi:hypothetical protein